MESVEIIKKTIRKKIVSIIGMISMRAFSSLPSAAALVGLLARAEASD